MSTTTAATLEKAVSTPRTNIRIRMLMVIALAVTINYLDRAILGIASPSIRHEFGIGPAEMGVLFSVFSWSYLFFQLPGGVLLDRFGNRMIYSIALVGWSLFTVFQGLTPGLAGFVVARLGLGTFEAPCFPANSNIVGMWFPRSERGRAIGVYTAAEYVGLGFLTPALFWILSTFGWRSLFIITGSIGILIGAVMWSFYRDPTKSKAVNAAELSYIEAGGGLVQKNISGTKFSFENVRALFAHRQMWGLCIGQFSVYATFVFFLTWFPTYLATQRHMAFIKIGIFASIPYIAGFFGILFAGVLTDWLLKHVSLNLARKLPVVAGLLLATTIISVNYVSNSTVVLAILSVAFFGQAMSSSGWAVLSEVAPKGLLGLVGGFFSFSANLSGIVVPIVIGFIVQETGSFVDALGFMGVIAAIGAFAWIFIIGDIHMLDIQVKGQTK
ncbi:MFS transporter [Acidocella aquatica]|uniref:MFS transporter n=1 Tax=Acidocella aquatica TaxID=1922313 RepID=A0ABQ6A2Y3_9PROT|nr:MFS transporter [Acidocella aquatica]GLR66146.1 MFS transporter [Acidocella aquatica]